MVLAATIATLFAYVLVLTFASWLKDFISDRLPKPFLSEGPNVEWAEKVISEISNGHGHRGLTIDTNPEFVPVGSWAVDTGPLRPTHDRPDYAVGVESEPSDSVTDQSRAEL